MSSKFVQIARRDVISKDEFTEYIGELDKKVRAKELAESIPIGELSSKVAGNIITPKNAPVPECLTCGLCCSSFLTVHVHRDDPAPRESYWEINVEARKRELTVDRVLKREPEGGRCISLNGELGKELSCKIYEDRPNLCREFETGSDKCHALRRISGLEPPLADHEMVNALMNLLNRETLADGDGLIFHVDILETDKDDVFEISVLIANEGLKILHTFDASEEDWIGSDFINLRMDQALELISSKSSK